MTTTAATTTTTTTTTTQKRPGEGGGGGGARAVAEAVQHFITAMDSLKLNLVAVDQVESGGGVCVCVLGVVGA